MNTPRKIPSQEDISDRAHQIWESAGQIDGDDLTHWLQAEKELLDQAGSRESRPLENPLASDVTRGPVTPPPTAGGVGRIPAETGAPFRKPKRQKP